ncbi:MAG TPA: hypothetical protein VE999_23165 [Gemmataceae bacterium]|nr:hypothetical protein [Gemmataceae bacterium]
MALSNLATGYSLASQNYQVQATGDSYLAYFFAAEAQHYADLGYNNPQPST